MSRVQDNPEEREAMNSILRIVAAALAVMFLNNAAEAKRASPNLISQITCFSGTRVVSCETERSQAPRETRRRVKQVYAGYPTWQGDTRYQGQYEPMGGRVNTAPVARSYDMGVTMLAHPPGCPSRAFCGCGASYRVFGENRRELWPSSAWFKFPRTSPASGTVAVRHGHVFVLESHVGGSEWLISDYNSGGHLSRRHVRSISGYTIVDPHGSRHADSRNFGNSSIAAILDDGSRRGKFKSMKERRKAMALQRYAAMTR